MRTETVDDLRYEIERKIESLERELRWLQEQIDSLKSDRRSEEE